MSKKQKLAKEILSRARSEMSLDAFAKKVTHGDKGASVMVLRGLANRGKDERKLVKKVKNVA